MSGRSMKFTVLLICLLIALLMRPFLLSAPVGRVIFLVAMTAFFVAAIRSLSDKRKHRWGVLAFGIASIAFRWRTLLDEPGSQLFWDVVGRVVEIIFLSLVVAMLLIAIFRQRSVTQDHILGAFAAYLLIAWVWGIIYSLVELAFPGSYHFAPQLLSQWERPEHKEWMLGYFSCCTLMTIGYGDITPVSPVARTLAMLEGMMGQLYVAVLVAVLVGVRVAQVTSLRDGHGKGGRS
jgi:hypothetical protein